MELTKEQAEAEAIRRWYQLPPHLRQTPEDAEAYAIRLDRELEFKTVTSRSRLIGAWLIREIFRARDAAANDEIEAFQQALDDDTDLVLPDASDEAA